jgi:hypothetical protein
VSHLHWTHWTQKRPRRMTLKIQDLAWNSVNIPKAYSKVTYGRMTENTMEGWQTIQWRDDRQYNFYQTLTWFVTRLQRQVPLLLTFPEHPSLPTYFFRGSCYSILMLCFYVLLIVVCPFVLAVLVILLSVLFRYTDSDYSLVNIILS